MAEQVVRALSGWMLTYGLHSTVALGVVWILERTRLVARPTTRDLLWKTALIAGVVTATLHTLVVSPSPQAGTEERRALVRQASAGHLTEEADGLYRTFEEVLHARTAAGAAAEPFLDRALLPDIQEASGAPMVRIEARLNNPSAGCLDFLRAGMDGGRSGVDRMRELCSSAPWVPAVPWVVMGLWGLGAALVALRRSRASAALDCLLQSREPVVGGYAREVLDVLERQHPRIGRVSLCRVDGLESPAVLGPDLIGLPPRADDLTSDELRVALAHEVGHLVRRDPFWLRLSGWMGTVLFFQPLNHLARRRLGEAAELCADDWAVERTGAPIVLARSLTRIAEWLTPQAPSPALAMARPEPGSLSRRVERILGPVDRRPLATRRRWALVGALVLLAACLPELQVPAPSVVRVHSDGPEQGPIEPAGARNAQLRIDVLVEESNLP